MQARHEELVALLQLQDIDLEIRSLSKKLEELPQREIIMAAREKKQGLEDKRSKVSKIKKDTVHKLTRLNDEVSSLTKKEQGVQAAIEAAHGDYRNVEARTKELAGIEKRLSTLSEEHDRISGELSEIEDLENQIHRAYEDISSREERAISSFKEEGGALKQSISDLESKREAVASQVASDTLKLYGKTANRTAGVAIARLVENRCGACRSSIETGQLVELRSQAPLGVCPACKRLLIIDA